MKRAAARQGNFLRKSASRRVFLGEVGAEGARVWVAMGHVREEGEGDRKC